MSLFSKALFSLCKCGDVVLGGAIFLIDANNLEYHLSASTTEGKKLGATNLLLHEASLKGKSLGCTRFHMGGGTTTESDDSLLFFKQGFSQLRATFKIGSQIFLPKEYEEIKTKWESEKNITSNRVLFYR